MQRDQDGCRWEWRTFASSLADLEARIGAAAGVEPRASSELYVLGPRDDLNLKLRDNVLDLKVLRQTDAGGLELWMPVAKIRLPASVDVVNDTLAQYGLHCPGADPLTQERMDTIVAPGAPVALIPVRKSRRCFRYAGCLAELTEMEANGQTLQSFCVESEHRERVSAALLGLGLSAHDNVSVCRALRRVTSAGASAARGAPSDRIETERKFLVDMQKWHASEQGVHYRQGYLSKARERTVRVRVAGNRATLTVKGPTVGLTRWEFEYAIPVEDASFMLAHLCEPPIIEKTRYREQVGDRTWEIDVFHGENDGLVIAEVELSSPAEFFEKPDWAGREVSDDPRYFNSNLLSSPYKAWASAD